MIYQWYENTDSNGQTTWSTHPYEGTTTQRIQFESEQNQYRHEVGLPTGITIKADPEFHKRNAELVRKALESNYWYGERQATEKESKGMVYTLFEIYIIVKETKDVTRRPKPVIAKDAQEAIIKVVADLARTMTDEELENIIIWPDRVKDFDPEEFEA